MFLARRERQGPDRYLRWKVAALVVGAVLVLWGSRVGKSWPVWAGIAVLAVGFLLRFLPRGTRGQDTASHSTNHEQETR
jgi:type II secretory pathway component PulL